MNSGPQPQYPQYTHQQYQPYASAESPIPKAWWDASNNDPQQQQGVPPTQQPQPQPHPYYGAATGPVPRTTVSNSTVTAYYGHGITNNSVPPTSYEYSRNVNAVAVNNSNINNTSPITPPRGSNQGGGGGAASSNGAGLIRLTLRKPMGIVFEPMVTANGVQRGVRICDLPRTGAAALSGKLQVGDELLSINDVTMSRLTFDEILDFIIEASADRVELLFRRPKKDEATSKQGATRKERGIKWADEEHSKSNKKPAESPASTKKSSKSGKDKEKRERRRRRRRDLDEMTDDGTVNVGNESFLDMLIDSICFSSMNNKTDYYDDESIYSYDDYDDETATIGSMDSYSTAGTYNRPSKASIKTSSIGNKESSSSMSKSQKLAPVVEEEQPVTAIDPVDMEYDTRSDNEETALDESANFTNQDEPSVNGSVLTMPTLDGLANNAPFATYSPLLRELLNEYNYVGTSQGDVYHFVVNEMLTRHEPEKVRLVNKLLGKYKNREEYLIKKLAGRYNVFESGIQPAIKEEEEEREDEEEEVSKEKNEESQALEMKEIHVPASSPVEEEEPLTPVFDEEGKISPIPDQSSIHEYGSPNNSPERAKEYSEEQSTGERYSKEHEQVKDDNFDEEGSDGSGYKNEEEEGQSFSETHSQGEEGSYDQSYEVGNETDNDEDSDEIDTTSPALIAQVSELLNFVYGKTSVPAQIDRVSTIMRAYEGRESVLLELLETKALIKANSVKSTGDKEGTPNYEEMNQDDYHPPDDISSVSGNSEHRFKTNVPPPPPRHNNEETKVNLEDELVTDGNFADFGGIDRENIFSDENIDASAISHSKPKQGTIGESPPLKANSQPKSKDKTSKTNKKKKGFFGIFKGKEKSKKNAKKGAFSQL